jgi:hypothetical protein
MKDRVKSAFGFVAITCGSPSPVEAVERDEIVSLQASVAAAEVPDGLKEFPGRYAFSGGEAERQALRDAVDAVVAEMNPLVRSIARNRLLENNKIAREVGIAADGSKVTIAFDDRSYTAVLGAAAVEVTGVSGDKLRLTHRMQGKRLMQTFDGDKGSRRNVISVRGSQLRVQVTVQSESLPDDLGYQLTFTRR